MHAHLCVYKSYIYELLIYLCLQGFISGFGTSLWLITDLQQLQSVSVIACLMACLMVMHSLEVIHDIATLHPFTNFINNVVHCECRVLNSMARY